jgi:hypothetical protein
VFPLEYIWNLKAEKQSKIKKQHKSDYKSFGIVLCNFKTSS